MNLLRRRCNISMGIALASYLCAITPSRAGQLVINEISPVALFAGDKYIEIQNIGPGSVNTFNWWICDQPSSVYQRILQVPQGSGTPTSSGIVLAENDFLLIRWRFPAGNYQVAPNASGSMTHTVDIGVPGFVGMSPVHANFSIWDQPSPNFPSFEAGGPMRDFLAWDTTNVYVGFSRTCPAAQVNLWPDPFVGVCGVDQNPQFVAVPSSQLMSEGFSINYNGGTSNSPADYYVGPPTPGEANKLPGDMDNDLDIDYDDSDILAACIDDVSGGTTRACCDLDTNGVVDCADWGVFLNLWAKYSELPAPMPPASCGGMPCRGIVHGDFDLSGVIDAADIAGYVSVALGEDTSPEGVCTADFDDNGVVDSVDTGRFVCELLGQSCP